MSWAITGEAKIGLYIAARRLSVTAGLTRSYQQPSALVTFIVNSRTRLAMSATLSKVMQNAPKDSGATACEAVQDPDTG